MQRDIITSTITWHLGLLGSNNFGEYTTFTPFTFCAYTLHCTKNLHSCGLELAPLTVQSAPLTTWPSRRLIIPYDIIFINELFADYHLVLLQTNK